MLTLLRSCLRFYRRRARSCKLWLINKGSLSQGLTLIEVLEFHGHAMNDAGAYGARPRISRVNPAYA